MYEREHLYFRKEKCPICGKKVKYDENVSAFLCGDHKENKVIPKSCIVKFGRSVRKRFTNFLEAKQFLTGLRFKTIEGTFDERDYQNSNPLGFENQVTKWLDYKMNCVAQSNFKISYQTPMFKAIDFFGAKRSIKTIKFGDIEDFLFSLE